MDRGAWPAAVLGVTKSQTRLSDYRTEFSTDGRVLKEILSPFPSKLKIFTVYTFIKKFGFQL